ncbi:hypothetical protein HZS_5931, partial [Henneguya salminicola]
MGITAQSMIVNGAYSASFTTIQKHYQLSTFQLSLIDVSYNVSFGLLALLLVLIPIYREMLYIGIGMLIISIGCIIFILPVYLEQNNRSNQFVSRILCNALNNAEESMICVSESDKYLKIMSIANSFIGLGAAPLHVLAISFIAKNVRREHGAIYQAIYLSSASIGSTTGVLVHAFVIKNPLHTSQENIYSAPHNENWVGAYWIVYLVGCIFSFAIFIPIVFFPSLHKTENLDTIYVSMRNPISLSNMWNATNEAITNISFASLSCSMFFDGIVTSGLNLLLPKYIETQFGFSSSKAAFMSGGIFNIASMGGLLCGGFLIKYFGASNKNLIKKVKFIHLMGCGFFLFLFFRCPTRQIYGVTQMDNKLLKYANRCTAKCNCYIKDYIPVCVDETETYYSPCSIGCTQQSGSNGSLEFSLCKCGKKISKKQVVKQGICNSKCRLLIPFLICGFIAIYLHFLIY